MRTVKIIFALKREVLVRVKGVRGKSMYILYFFNFIIVELL